MPWANPPIWNFPSLSVFSVLLIPLRLAMAPINRSLFLPPRTVPEMVNCAKALSDSKHNAVTEIDLIMLFVSLNPQAHRGMYLTYVFTLPPFVRITGIRFDGYNLSP